MSLGFNISRKRKSLHFSQEYVAEQLGVSRQSVSKWERNKSKPSTENLIKLADLLDCNMKELTSPEQYIEEEKNVEDQIKGSKRDIRMQMAACFGRIFILVGFVGYMNIDMAEFGSLSKWFPSMWWGAIFLIGLILTFLGSHDYFNKKSGSKKIIWFDVLFTLIFFLYELFPFERNISTFIILIYGIIILSIMNIKFWIPVWRKPFLSSRKE